MEKNIAYSYNKHLFSTLVELVAIEDIEVCDYILMPDGYFLCVDDIEKEFRDDDDDDEFEYYFGDEDSDDEVSDDEVSDDEVSDDEVSDDEDSGDEDSDYEDEISEEEDDENTVYTIYNLHPVFQKNKRFRQKSKQFPFGLHKLSTASMISNIPPKAKFLVMRNLTFS
jgi:hypothetical protein